MAQRYITDLSSKGDFVHRDVYFRKLHAVGDSNASANSYVNIDNTKQHVTKVQSSATNGGEGKWSVFVRSSTTGNVEATPRVQVTPNVTTVSSDVTTIEGALTVSNYASFEEDVDITTGSVTVGRTLIVDGPSYHGNVVQVSRSNNAAVLSEQALTFNSAWRLMYDETIAGLAFEQNTGSAESPSWIRRFEVKQP